MGVPAPQPAPPVPKVLTPPRLITTPQGPELQTQDVKFRNMLHGPTLIIVIEREYFTLPCALLIANSAYLASKIQDMFSTPNKKRKIDAAVSDADDDAKPVIGSEEKISFSGKEKDSKPDTHNGPLMLEINNIDPDIFGLFLSFIYKGGYSPTVDVRPTCTPEPYTTSKPGMKSTPSSRTCSPPALDVNTPHPSASINTYTPNNSPATGCFTNIIEAPNPIHAQTDFIPPSIYAYLLAQTLKSKHFLNYTISRIYQGIGKFFVLSPSLINLVWVQTKTQILNTASTAIDMEGSLSKNMLANWSPLRRLLLDILIAYWPSQQSNFIARNDPVAWNKLFDAHQDLRQEFILGLQGGIKVLPLLGYLVEQ